LPALSRANFSPFPFALSKDELLWVIKLQLEITFGDSPGKDQMFRFVVAENFYDRDLDDLHFLWIFGLVTFC
jgi:hypothetical protein